MFQFLDEIRYSLSPQVIFMDSYRQIYETVEDPTFMVNGALFV